MHLKNEKIIQTKICKKCSTSFDITDRDIKFYDKISPKFGDKKYIIPTPTLCSKCRKQRRSVWRNERKLYKRKCDLTKKEIVSIYSPDKPYKVYNREDWWSDKWDGVDF
jgi:hypothetical protein